MDHVLPMGPYLSFLMDRPFSSTNLPSPPYPHVLLLILKGSKNAIRRSIPWQILHPKNKLPFSQLQQFSLPLSFSSSHLDFALSSKPCAHLLDISIVSILFTPFDIGPMILLVKFCTNGAKKAIYELLKQAIKVELYGPVSIDFIIDIVKKLL